MTDYLPIITTAIATGFGSAIGQYFATKYAITHLFENNKLKQIVEVRKEDKPQI